MASNSRQGGDMANRNGQCSPIFGESEKWRRRIFELKAEHPSWGAPRITQALKEEAGEWKEPPQRTVSRRLVEWDALPEEVRAGYQLFNWPESMGGALPWEASQALLELLACYPAGKRPTIRMARAFWRVTLAAPTMPVDCRGILASFLVAAEVGQRKNPAETRRLVEEALVQHTRRQDIPGWLQALTGENSPEGLLRWWTVIFTPAHNLNLRTRMC